MVTSVDNDQRSSDPAAETAPVPEQPTAPVTETIDVPAPSADTTIDEPAAGAPDVATTSGGEGEPIAEPGAAVAQATSGDADPAIAPAVLTARLQAAEERSASAEAALAELTARLAALESRAELTENIARRLERAIVVSDEHGEAVNGRLAELAAAAAQDRAGAGAVATEVAELQETVRRLDQDTAIAIAREVERHTTAELVDGQQRLHQASVAMAGLAQALADASRQVTPELTADAARTLLDSFAVDVDLVLQQLGHEALGVTCGDVFDAKRHRALRRVATTDATADRTVARVIRDGYRTPATNRVLLFADVEVYRAADPTPVSAQDRSSEKGS